MNYVTTCPSASDTIARACVCARASCLRAPLLLDVSCCCVCFLSHGGFSGTNRKAGETLSETLNARAVWACVRLTRGPCAALSQWIQECVCFWRICVFRDGRSECVVSSGSESRRGGGVARASRARWEFPGAGQRERQRRVRVMRTVRLMLYYYTYVINL